MTEESAGTGQGPEQLRQEIAETRAGMDETIDEIAKRVSPRGKAERTKVQLQQRISDFKQSATKRLNDRKNGAPEETSGAGSPVPLVPVAGGLVGTTVASVAAAMIRQRRTKVREAQRRSAQSRIVGIRALSAASALGVAGMLLTPRKRGASKLTARDVMTGGAECALETDTLVEVARKMARLDVGALPICGLDGRLKGMLTDRDVVVKAVAEQRDLALVTAGEFAQGKPVTIGADDSVAEAIRTMSRHKVRRLPVIDGHTLIGVVSQADIALHVDESQTGALVESISAAP